MLEGYLGRRSPQGAMLPSTPGAWLRVTSQSDPPSDPLPTGGTAQSGERQQRAVRAPQAAHHSHAHSRHGSTVPPHLSGLHQPGGGLHPPSTASFQPAIPPPLQTLLSVFSFPPPCPALPSHPAGGSGAPPAALPPLPTPLRDAPRGSATRRRVGGGRWKGGRKGQHRSHPGESLELTWRRAGGRPPGGFQRAVPGGGPVPLHAAERCGRPASPPSAPLGVERVGAPEAPAPPPGSPRSAPAAPSAVLRRPAARGRSPPSARTAAALSRGGSGLGRLSSAAAHPQPCHSPGLSSSVPQTSASSARTRSRSAQFILCVL